MQYRKLWIAFIAVVILSFAILGYLGAETYRMAPPVPERVVTTEGKELFPGRSIKDGQNVWSGSVVEERADLLNPA